MSDATFEKVDIEISAKPITCTCIAIYKSIILETKNTSIPFDFIRWYTTKTKTRLFLFWNCILIFFFLFLFISWRFWLFLWTKFKNLILFSEKWIFYFIFKVIFNLEIGIIENSHDRIILRKQWIFKEKQLWQWSLSSQKCIEFQFLIAISCIWPFVKNAPHLNLKRNLFQIINKIDIIDMLKIKLPHFSILKVLNLPLLPIQYINQMFL